MPDCADATTMSMAGPFTCSALTVIDPAFPPDELVCSLTMTLMPPGKEMARFGLDTRIDWPATTNPTSSAFPLTADCPLLQLALEFDCTTSAAIRPPNKFKFATDDWDWLLVPPPDVVLRSASADTTPGTLMLATDVLRLPPLDGSCPVSASATVTPSAFASSATALPLKVLCAKLTVALKSKTAAKQIEINDALFSFTVRLLG
jgi:hypothetical protein